MSCPLSVCGRPASWAPLSVCDRRTAGRPNLGLVHVLLAARTDCLSCRFRICRGRLHASFRGVCRLDGPFQGVAAADLVWLGLAQIVRSVLTHTHTHRLEMFLLQTACQQLCRSSGVDLSIRPSGPAARFSRKRGMRPLILFVRTPQRRRSGRSAKGDGYLKGANRRFRQCCPSGHPWFATFFGFLIDFVQLQNGGGCESGFKPHEARCRR